MGAAETASNSAGTVGVAQAQARKKGGSEPPSRSERQTGVAKPLRDEVNEPLGLWPAAQPRPAGGSALTTISFTAPLVVAVAMAAFTLGRHEALPPRAQLALEAQAPPAPARVEPPPVRAEPEAAPKSAVPPVAAAEAAANGASVARSGAGAPTPLIIDVQQALAARKAKAEPFVLR